VLGTCSILVRSKSNTDSGLGEPEIQRRRTTRRSAGITGVSLLTDLYSEVKIGFMDDVTLAADIQTLDTDVNTIISRSADTDLSLNISKCEIITDDPAAISDTSVLSHFMKVSKQDMKLIGAPVLKGPSQDAALRH